MPNINTPQVTFAFSKRQDAWTTRYSFFSSCYANCSDQLISFKRRDNKSKAWLHDTNMSRNNFYGEAYPSEIEISFNDNPSEIKIFKSMSIETNRDDFWIADFTTNEEHKDENNQESGFSTGVSLDVSDKEGFKYFEIPRSNSNSTANIVPVPSILKSSFGLSQIQSTMDETLEEFLESENQPNYLYISLPLDESSVMGSFSVPVGGSSAGGGVEILGYFSVPYNSDELEGAAVVGMYTFQEFLEQLINQNFYSDLDSSINASIKILSVEDGSIKIVLNVPSFLIGSVSASESFFSAIKDFLIVSDGLFAVSPSKYNGDQMRGPYLNVKLACLGDDPLELHSVNTDYIFSSSAARLTQNT